MTDEYEATPEMTEEPHLGGGHPIDADASVRADGGGRPVTDLEGIGDTYGESLADAGVETAEQLLSTDTSEIAEETGIPESRIEQWKATAEDVLPDERIPDEDSGTGSGAADGEEVPADSSPAVDAEATAEDGEGLEDEETVEDDPAAEAESVAEDEGGLEDDPGDEVPEGEDMFGTTGADESGEDAGEGKPGDPDATEGTAEASGEPEATGDPGELDATDGPGESDAGTSTADEPGADAEPSGPADVTDAGEVTGGGTASGGGSETVTETETESTSSEVPERSEEELEEEILEPEERVGPTKKFCTSCGEPIDESAEICPECGVRQSGTPPGAGSADSGTEEKDPAIAGLLSFLIPGAGNLFNGATKIGAIFLIGWILWIGIGWFIAVPVLGFVLGLITIFIGGIGGLLAPVLVFLVEVVIHVGAAYHAYGQAQKINAGTISVD
jgi:RNA polymerase subunit RPABC4/transcription elongation factor Spt4